LRGLGDTEEVYFEFDAWLSAAVRFRNALIGPVWDGCGGTGKKPDQWPKLFKNSPEGLKIPDELRPVLDKEFAAWGARLQTYRNCSHHWVPLVQYHSMSFLELLDGVTWATSFWLPEDPTVARQQDFRFSNRVEALTYALDITDRLLGMAEEIFGLLPKGEDVTS
jgi:hypothetical protein